MNAQNVLTDIGGDQSTINHYKSEDLTCIKIIYALYLPVDVVNATKER